MNKDTRARRQKANPGSVIWWAGTEIRSTLSFNQGFIWIRLCPDLCYWCDVRHNAIIFWCCFVRCQFAYRHLKFHIFVFCYPTVTGFVSPPSVYLGCLLACFFACLPPQPNLIYSTLYFISSRHAFSHLVPSVDRIWDMSVHRLLRTRVCHRCCFLAPDNYFNVFKYSREMFGQMVH